MMMLPYYSSTTSAAVAAAVPLRLLLRRLTAIASNAAKIVSVSHLINENNCKSISCKRYHSTSASTTTTTTASTPIQKRSSSSSSSIKEPIGPARQNRGAFALLKALNEVHEKDGVQVARLVSSFEALLPMAQWEEAHSSSEELEEVTMVPHPQAHMTSQPHTSDPAFFSFPLYLNHEQRLRLGTVLTRSHVYDLLQATRRGKRISVETIDVLLKTVAWHYRHKPKVIRLPPLLPNQTLTVVGDLHGSLADLEAVLAMTGEPSPNNLIVFNGDLADRGDHGIENIALVCALKLAYENYVFINRGNHEDLALSVAYGLASELQHKYGSSTFRKTLGPRLEAFFCSLPLATVVEKDALIVHAGPPPPGITLDDVQEYMSQQIQQHERQLDMFSRTIRTSACTWNNNNSNNTEDKSKDKNDNNNVDKSNFAKTEEIIESLLWSDPEVDEVDGVQLLATIPEPHLQWKHNESRGAGFRFDANIVETVLLQEGLRRFIRSHESVHDGCVRYAVNSQQGTRLEFFTVFSASRYPYKEGFNRGAILTLHPDGSHRIRRYVTEDDEPKVISHSSSITSSKNKLFQPFHPITTTTTSSSTVQHDVETTTTATTTTTPTKVDLPSLRRALREAVAPHRKELIDNIRKSHFKYASGKQTVFPYFEAVNILVKTLKLDPVIFQKRGPQLALARALAPEQYQDQHVEPDTIQLEPCVEQLLKEVDDNDNEDGGNGNNASSSFHPEMAPHYPWLRAVFEMVDGDHDGVISKKEWVTAVTKINAKLPEGSKLIRPEETWHLLDIDADGAISSKDWDELAKALCRR